MEKHFFKEADIIDVDEEFVQLVDSIEEVVQELISHTRESSVVLCLFHVQDAFRNQDLSYLRVISGC